MNRSDHDDELEYDGELENDDAIIGTVFKWSSLGMLVLLVAIAGLVFVINRKPRVEPTVIDKDTSQIKHLEVDVQEIPLLKFTDVTAASGITFSHKNGAVGEKLLPETMGGGVAFLDYNGDGHQDIFFVNSCPWKATDSPTHASASRLYAGDGTGNFRDVTQASQLDQLNDVYGMGCAVGDYDNDGDEDIYVTALGLNRLLQNDNGVFRDVTPTAGVAGDDEWSSSAGFFDYDNDGDLDLFVGNYVKWSREVDFELNYSLNGSDRAYGPPTNYQGLLPYLFRNEGDGHFTNVAESARLHMLNDDTGTPIAKSLAVLLVDIDKDGYADITIANDTVQNQLFHNQRDGTFLEIGSVAGLAFDRSGTATGAMGIDVGYPAEGTSLAIGIGNFANETTSLYLQDDSLVFNDQSTMEGVGAPSRSRLSFGLLFLDVDLDGRQDLLQANGHLEDEINQIQPSQTYRQPAQLFWNQGPAAGGCFVIVPDDKTGDLSRPIVGRGAAYADIDEDGDLDVVLTQTGGAPLLLRNDNSNGNHWLRVKLVGTKSNRDGIGARVAVSVGEQTQYRFVSPTRSYLSNVELPVTFGLGTADSADSVEIQWPSGATTTLTDVAANQTLTVVESSSSNSAEQPKSRRPE